MAESLLNVFLNPGPALVNPDHQAQAMRDPASLVGAYVKKAFAARSPFTGEPTFEHMWVRIQGIRNGRLFGALDNDPVLVCGVRDGDRVEMDPAEVEMILRP